LTVRRKTLLILAVTFSAFVGILYIASRTLLLGRFTQLERDAVRQDVDRSSAALSAELQSMDALALDNASWDAAYDFMLHPSPKFIRSAFGQTPTAPFTRRATISCCSSVHMAAPSETRISILRLAIIRDFSKTFERGSMSLFRSFNAPFTPTISQEFWSCQKDLFYLPRVPSFRLPARGLQTAFSSLGVFSTTQSFGASTLGQA
jgi:hypothetical protein